MLETNYELFGCTTCSAVCTSNTKGRPCNNHSSLVHLTYWNTNGVVFSPFSVCVRSYTLGLTGRPRLAGHRTRVSRTTGPTRGPVPITRLTTTTDTQTAWWNRQTTGTKTCTANHVSSTSTRTLTTTCTRTWGHTTISRRWPRSSRRRSNGRRSSSRGTLSSAREEKVYIINKHCILRLWQTCYLCKHLNRRFDEY